MENIIKYNSKQINYYHGILVATSEIGSCDRKKVGAIIVRDKCIISTGVNGAPRGQRHCNDIGHLEMQYLKKGWGFKEIDENENFHCIRTVHGEMNAILNACRNGININGCDMFTLTKPCFNCMKHLINSGIRKVFYFGDYEDDFQKEFEINQFCEFIQIKEGEDVLCVE